jgi:hypothetical protein
MSEGTTAAIAAVGLFVGVLALGCRFWCRKLIEMFAHTRVIYVCEKLGDDYVVRKIFRKSFVPAITVADGVADALLEN